MINQKDILKYLDDIEKKSIKNKIIDFLYHIWRKLKHYKYLISCYFFPRQKWAQKYLGRTYNDLDFCIEEFLFGCIIEYIESERALEIVRWESNKKDKEIKNKLIEIYCYAKYGRKSIQEGIHLSCPEEETTGEYNVIYKDVIELEKLLKEKDDEYLEWIINHRKYLWT